jgi:integrase
MATVVDRWETEPERYGRGKRYQVRYRDDAKGWRRKAFTRKADADRYAAQVQHQLDQGTFRDPNAGHTPFTEYANTWLTNRVDLAPATYNSYRGCLDNHLIPAFGSVEIARIRPEHGRSFIAGFEGTKNSTARKATNLASAILKCGVLDGVIPSNPFAHIALPKTPPSAANPFDPTELDALLEAMHPWHRCLVLSAAVLGARWGELVGLQPQSIDLLHRQVHIKDQLSEARGRPTRAPLKTPSSHRSITIPKFLVPHLEEQLAQRSTPEFVFTTVGSDPIRKSNFNRRYWKPAITKSGLNGHVFHDLRATAVALAIAGGAHPKAIQERLGHASINTTFDVYGHMFPSLDADIADRLDQSMGTTFGIAN